MPPFRSAPKVLDRSPISGHRVLRLGDGTAHHDVVAAGLARLLRGHDPLLVAGGTVREPDAGGDNIWVIDSDGSKNEGYPYLKDCPFQFIYWDK